MHIKIKTFLGIVCLLISGAWYFGAYNESGELLYSPQDCDDDMSKIYFDLGASAQNRCDYARAIENYIESLQIKPYRIQTIDHLGFCYENIGNKDDALKTYFKKLFYAAPSSLLPSHISSIQPWIGQDVRGRCVYVYNDVSCKDCLLLTRFLFELEKRGARVVFKPHASLTSLFESCLKTIKTIDEDSELSTTPIDFAVSLGKIPYLLGISYNTVPERGGYLEAVDSQLPKQALDLLAKQGLKVGISWKAFDDESVTIPQTIHIDAILSSLNSDNLSCFLLHDQDTMIFDRSLCNLAPFIKSMTNLADVISRLDLVISIDNTVAHIAGALGKPVLLLLDSCSDWRWFCHCEGKNSVWYQSMKKFAVTQETGVYEILAYLHDEVARRSATFLATR